MSAAEVRKANGEEVEVRACWNEIGVHGDGSCPELKSYVRCRNCPVYWNAGARLLDRPLPDGYRREWSDHFSHPRKVAAATRASAVVFRISQEWLALPALAFQEIADRRPVHSLPHRRQGVVLGLANIRGELLLCVSLGHMLNLEKLSPPEELRKEYSRLMVGEWTGNRIVFPVDEVRGLHRFHLQELKEPPATLVKSNLSCTQGILHHQGNAVGLLDADLLFSAIHRSLT